MKINLPVSGQERLFATDQALVSKTDTKGIITFANQDFIEICGYSEMELVGSNHNIIRHPDMPPAAFEGMWATLKRGAPWHGLVKNRCKNGDHYWVDAKVVPIKKRGQIIGYMSVRTCPSRADVAAAEVTYQEAATAPEILKETGVAAWKKHLSIRNGIPLWIAFVMLMMIAGGVLGISGLMRSNAAIERLYAGELASAQQLHRLQLLMAEERAQLVIALQPKPSEEMRTAPLATLEKTAEEIEVLWTNYAKDINLANEQALADLYRQARKAYVADGLLPLRAALEAKDPSRSGALLNQEVIPRYATASNALTALLAHLAERRESGLRAVTEGNRSIATVAIAGIVLGCLVLVAAGVFFFRVTVMPLQKAVLALEDIAEGNLSGNVDTQAYGEPGRVMAAVRVMQMHLKVMMHEIRQSSNSIHRQCRHLNQTMMNLAEHSEEQHDRVHQTLDAINESGSNLASMATRAAALALPASDAISRLAAPEALEPMPTELLALFGELPVAAAAEHSATPSAAPAATLEVASGSKPTADLPQQVQELASATQVQALAVQEGASQLTQVATLIVQNREEVQGAWAASQHLEKTARELDGLVKYFE